MELLIVLVLSSCAVDIVDAWLTGEAGDIVDGMKREKFMNEAKARVCFFFVERIGAAFLELMCQRKAQGCSILSCF